MVLSAGLVFFVNLLFFFMSFKSYKDMEEMSVYECGFDMTSITRMMFSYRFFLLAILFLIFDVEIALMLPIPFLDMTFFLFYFFLIVLIVGLAYEYFCGSLDWL